MLYSSVLQGFVCEHGTYVKRHRPVAVLESDLGYIEEAKCLPLLRSVYHFVLRKLEAIPMSAPCYRAIIWWLEEGCVTCLAGWMAAKAWPKLGTHFALHVFSTSAHGHPP